MLRLTREEWLAHAERRYGASLRKIKFSCPSCGHVQSGQDFLDLGMTPEVAATRVGFSCIGRWMPSCSEMFGRPGPCNFTNGGLIRLGPLVITDEEGTEHWYFDFAGEPLAAPAAASA